MAFAVASVGTSGGYGTSAIITKPTGLAVGELMIALIESNAGVTPTINTLAGWTLVATRSRTNGSVSMQYKIADAGDVAASNFTFTDTSGSRVGGAILRVTGNTPTGSLDTSDNDFNNAASSATISFTTTVSPTYNGSLLVAVFGASGGGGGIGSIGSYVASDGSLSWTEAFEQAADAGSTDPIGGGAYAIQSTKTALTTYGATLSFSQTAHAGIIAVFTPAISATADVSHLTVTASLDGLVGSNTATANVGNLAIPPTLNGVSAKSSSDDTRWTNPDKPSATWTNPDK